MSQAHWVAGALRRRRRRKLVARYLPGDSGAATVSRSTTATYTQAIPDALLVQLPGSDTSAATITRSTTATYTTS